MSDQQLITIEHLSFQHEHGQQVFDDVCLRIPRGKITAIMGPSGTGKTTLLRLIGGQLQPNQGKICIDGLNINELSRRKLFSLRKRIALMFQSGGLFTHLNVYDNVAFPLREHTNLSEPLIHHAVLLKLQMVGLRGAAFLLPSELSGGMARRVALARAIALDPEVVMLDEPFSGQDPISMGILMKLVRTLNNVLNLTTIIVSHDVQETLSIADYVYVISDKKIIGQGSADEIRQNDSLKVRQFIQGLPDGPVPFDYPAKPIEQDLLQA